MRFTGAWTALGALAQHKALRTALDARQTPNSIILDGTGVTQWDTGFLVTLKALADRCTKNSIQLNSSSLPEGAARLLNLATTVTERKGARRTAVVDPTIAKVGKGAIALWAEFESAIAFVGELTLSLWRFVRGKARFQRSDLYLTIDECGPQALPIVILISTLVGLILAFIGAVQLEQFGAQLYVANLVGIAMVREMGAIMAGIIIAGRTGAAFAAQLGTMQVNEEIDALKTLGIQPMDFLVLPRALALILMMPLLCIFADIMGIIGGGVIGVATLGISPTLYWDQTLSAITLSDCAIGVVKSAVFGVLVAIAGCMRGMQSGRSASAVGEAATSAVVLAIVLIVVTDAVFAVVTNIIGL